ncbi:O-linked N-acetylglucosamine transferase family protein [Novosphingobium beihaiensis]|uniref:O-linked N-acetylglucosamine transferase family protein n=1 Tax=Novosphingobium beihaiensis TaxID=2930389 RepID=UPI003898D619
MPQDEQLGRLQNADIVLDTAPYGAHTTASDALWAGVPVSPMPEARSRPASLAAFCMPLACRNSLPAKSRTIFRSP